MAHRDLTFKITDKVRIHLDTKRNAVILLETHDGKSVKLETDYKTINKIHDQIQKLEERVQLWVQVRRQRVTNSSICRVRLIE